jgi:hypothetical protein
MEARLCAALGYASGNALLQAEGIARKGYGTAYAILSAHKPGAVLDRRDEWQFGHYDTVAHGFFLPFMRGKFTPARQGLIPFIEPDSGPRLSLPGGGLFLYLLHLCKTRLPASVVAAEKEAGRKAKKGNGNGQRSRHPVPCSRRRMEAQLGLSCHRERRDEDWTALNHLGWVRIIWSDKNTRPTYIISGPPEGLLGLIGLAAATHYEEDPVAYMEAWEANIAAGRWSTGWVLEQVAVIGWRLTPAGQAAVDAEVQASGATL